MKKNNRKIELLFYKCIGVLWLKKILLKNEEILHIHHGYRLKNYHPESTTADGLKNFCWFLLYNAMLHAVSIGFAVLYFVSAYVVNTKSLILDCLAIILIIINLYCIFLQRYTYLKMQELLEKMNSMLNKQYEKKIEKIDNMQHIRISEKEYSEALKLMDRVESVFTQKGSCYIAENDIVTLEQMKRMLSNVDISIRSPGGEEVPYELSVDGGIKEFDPCKRADIMVNQLKRILNRKAFGNDKKRSVLITTSEKCEELYLEIFGDAPTETMLVRIKLIRYIYKNIVQAEI